MHRIVGRKFVTNAAAVLASAAVLAGVTVGTAHATDYSDPENSEIYGHAGPVQGNGRFVSGLNTTIFRFDGKYAEFENDVTAGAVLTHYQGPVTCVNVQGHRAGFLFTLGVGSGIGPSPFTVPASLFGQVVSVTIEDNGSTSADKISVSAAMPAGTFTGCAPGTATNTLSEGNVKVEHGKHGH